MWLLVNQFVKGSLGSMVARPGWSWFSSLLGLPCLGFELYEGKFYVHTVTSSVRKVDWTKYLIGIHFLTTTWLLVVFKFCTCYTILHNFGVSSLLIHYLTHVVLQWLNVFLEMFCFKRNEPSIYELCAFLH